MNLVEKEKLVGFRPPTMAEKKKVLKYMKKSFGGTLKVASFWNVAFSVFAASLLISLVTEFKERTLAENFLYLILFASFAAATFFNRLHRNTKKQILRMISNGQYHVMECRAYDISFSAAMTSKAMVKIFNDQEQYCKVSFVTDAGIAKKYGEDKNIKLLLLKCGEDFYELISE